MNNDPNNDQLLDDMLKDVAPAAFREELLNRTLKQVRRRRHARQSSQILLVAAIIATALIIWPRPTPKIVQSTTPAPLPELVHAINSLPLPPEMIVRSDPASVPLISTPVSSFSLIETSSAHITYKEIDDNDLFTALKGQPVLLVRRTPHEAELLIVDPVTQLVHPVDEKELSQP